MRKLLCVAGVVAGLMAASQPADASMILQLKDITGGTAVSCNNASAACGGLFSGAINGTLISFNGSVGGFSVVATVASSNVPGDPSGSTLNIVNLQITNSSGAARDLEIDLAGLGFTGPGGAGSVMSLSGSGSYSTNTGIAGSTVTSQSFASASNTAGTIAGTVFDGGAGFTTSDGACVMAVTPGPPSSGACNQTTSSWTRTAASFGLLNVMTFHLASGQSLNTTSNTLSTVPEPASMMLLGTGLIGLARSVRRRRKNATV